MSFKIIDAHMHLGYLSGYDLPEPDVATLLEAMDRLEIGRCISANNQSLTGNPEKGLLDDLAAHDASGGRIFAYLFYDPEQIEKSRELITRYHADPRCVGIKIHPSFAKVRADDERYRPLWELAKETGLPILSHTWAVSSYNPSQIYAAAELFEQYLREYPEVRFVFGHSGGRYSGIKAAMELGKKYPNTYFDITGDIWLNGLVETLAENIGAHRMVYGSDCSMIGQRPMMGAVLGADISVLEKEQILGRTAARLYFGED